MKKIISIMMAVLMLASMMSAIGVTAATTPNSSLDRYKITLDPGHGLTSNGWDGADGATDWGGEVEDKYNWRIANQTKATLQAAGVTVYMTKSSLEACPSFQTRIDTATNNGSGTFVSIHNNSSDDPRPSGSQVFIGNRNYLPECDDRSRELGITIQDKLRDEVGVPVQSRPYSENSSNNYYPDGTRQDYYGIIQRGKRARLHAVLIVECCFQSNQSDVQTFLLNPQKVLDMGTAIAHGIMEYYGISGEKYHTMIEPDGLSPVGGENKAPEISAVVQKGTNATYGIKGWSVHEDEATGYEYQVNGGSWTALPAELRSDVANATTSYPQSKVNSFNLPLNVSSLNTGANTIKVRGKTASGGTYDIATYNLFVNPAPGTTYMTTNKDRYCLNEPIKITAKGDCEGAWVGLFKDGETPGSVTSLYWFEMHAGEVTVNDLVNDGIANSRASTDFTPGTYKLYTFVDEDYYQDPNIPVKTLTIIDSYHSFLDDPASTGTSVSKGEMIHTQGWALHPDGLSAIQISIDNGAFVNMSTYVRGDVSAAYPDYATCCADMNAFKYDIPTSNLTVSSHTATIQAVTKNNETFEIDVFTFEVTPMAYDGKITLKDDSGLTIDESADGKKEIVGVKLGMTAEQLTALFDGEYAITDAKGDALEGKIASGCIIKLSYEGAFYDTAVIIVDCDLDGNGIASTKDIIRAKKFMADSSVVCYSKAADLDRDGVVSAEDIAAIAQTCVG